MLVPLSRLASSQTVGLTTLSVSFVWMVQKTKPGLRAFCSAASTNNQEGASAIAKEPLPVIYQYQICPFCHRVKACLDYLKVPYETVEVNPLTKGELKFSKDYKKVPLAKFGDEVLGDSSVIIDCISKNYAVDPRFLPSDSNHWIDWSEKRLAVLLYPNITRSFEESWECFSYALDVPTWSWVNRLSVRSIGAVAMSFANGKIKKKYNIVDERADLVKVLNEWKTALGDKKFLHGDTITLPDLMVYGVLRAVRPFRTFKEVVEVDYALMRWYLDVEAVTSSQESCAVAYSSKK